MGTIVYEVGRGVEVYKVVCGGAGKVRMCCEVMGGESYLWDSIQYESI